MKKSNKKTKDLWQLQTLQIKNWLEQHRIKLVYCREQDHCDYYNRTIRLNKKWEPERGFYILLHECGHAKIHMNSAIDKRFSFDELRYNKKRCSKNVKIRCLEIEFKAWELGKALAKKLGLYINEEVFDKVKTKGINCYCEIVCDKTEPFPYTIY